MIVTSEMIWNELKEQRKMLESIMRKDIEHSIEERSLSRAATLLKIGDDKLLGLIKERKIKARKVRNRKAKTGYSYKIPLREIYRYQQEEIGELVEEELQDESLFDLAKKTIDELHKES